MNRRQFLGGVLSLVAVSVAPSVATIKVPVIYGDGVHDDWAGLQVLFNGEPFSIEGNIITSSECTIKNGNFVLSKTLRICGAEDKMINNVRIGSCNFVCSEHFSGDTVVQVSHVDHFFARDVNFDTTAITDPKSKLYPGYSFRRTSI